MTSSQSLARVARNDCTWRAVLLLLCGGLWPTLASAQAPAEEPAAEGSEREPGAFDDFSYGEKGLTYAPADSATDLWIGLRFQMRADTHEGNLVTAADLREDPGTSLEFRRARLKGGGTLFFDWLDVYSEYNFPTEALLDFRATFKLNNQLSVRIGQWKSEFNRERVDSSGKQQLVERSIMNYWFTVDRQLGVSATTRLGEGTSADTKFWLEALSGTGRGGSIDAGKMLWLGRAQWNPMGKVLPFSQSDLKRREEPLSSIALAGIVGSTAYSRFSGSGGGNLPGLEEGDYDLSQLMFETAVHYRGLGWQQEVHWKRLESATDETTRELAGGYAQLGSFVNEWWPSLSPSLELVARYALVDPDRDQAGDTQQEWTLGANWFFNGHRNKLTVDYSWLDFEDPGEDATGQRLRLQWELSI